MSRTVFVRFLTIVALLAGLIAYAGYHLAGRFGADASRATIVGCLIALVGSVVGALPALAAQGRPRQERLPAIYLAMAARLGAVVVLALLVAAFGHLPVRPLLISAVICHAALLVPDSLLTIRLVSDKPAD